MIICSLKLAVFLELCSWKTVCFSVLVMSADFHAKWRLLFIYQDKGLSELGLYEQKFTVYVVVKKHFCANGEL